jgi:hypothetical protein
MTLMTTVADLKAALTARGKTGTDLRVTPILGPN